MYIFVRNDLSNAQKAVQSIHAAIEAARILDKQVEHPYTILLCLKNEAKLREKLTQFQNDGFSCFPFTEPDRNNEMTAFAVGYVYGEQREKFKKYQLLV